MKYIFGKNVNIRHVRIFELLEKPYLNEERQIVRPHLSSDEIYNSVKYLYKVNPYLSTKPGSIIDCRNDLVDMINRSGLWRDQEGKYYI